MQVEGQSFFFDMNSLLGVLLISLQIYPGTSGMFYALNYSSLDISVAVSPAISHLHVAVWPSGQIQRLTKDAVYHLETYHLHHEITIFLSP